MSRRGAGFKASCKQHVSANRLKTGGFLFLRRVGPVFLDFIWLEGHVAGGRAGQEGGEGRTLGTMH